MVALRQGLVYLVCMMLFFPLAAGAEALTYLDRSFNRPHGFVLWETPMTQGERPNGVAIQRDGKILVVDTTGENGGDPQMALIRLNPDGTPDNSFGVGGRVLYDSQYLSFATDVAIQQGDQDFKVVVAGFRAPKNLPLYDLVVVRYLPDGTLDSSFNGGEIIVQTRVSFDGVDTVASLDIQRDGKILVATHEATAGGDTKKLLLLRFEKNGTPDNSFGTNGVAELAEYTYGDPESGGFQTDVITGRKVKLSLDGTAIYVLAKVFAYTMVLKYDLNGNLDSLLGPFFGLPVFGALPRSMEIQPDGKIVVVGEAGAYPFILRYTTDGNPDPTFGNGLGVVYFDYAYQFSYSDGGIRSSSARDVAILGDGSILLIGSCPVDHDGDGKSEDMDIFLARYTPDGTMDVSFGENGVVTFDGGWRDGVTYAGDVGEAVSLQADGKIVVVGSVKVYDDPANPLPALSHNDLVVVRFTEEPSPVIPEIDVSPGAYNYGELPKGATKAQQFTIWNRGSADFCAAGIDVANGDTSEFLVEEGTCGSLTPTIVAGGQCAVTVRFAPGSEGRKRATLRVLSNDPNARGSAYTVAEVPLEGTAVSTQPHYTLTVRTDGNGAGFVVSKPRGIKCGNTWSVCSAVYEAGAQVTLYAVGDGEESRFTGWSGSCSGRKECKVLMDQNKEVGATFRADPTLVVWPRQKDFRNVRIGKQRMSFFVIKNSIRNGRRPLEIGSLSLLPPQSPFKIFRDECSGRFIAPKGDCVFGVVFEPDQVGTHEGQIAIPSNDPDAPETVVTMTGYGLMPPPPKPPKKR